MDKKIAVITPAYNSEKYIKTCLETVTNQDYKNLTHYIYDDNSSDATTDIIKNYNGHDVCLIQSNKNRGQSFARNTLILAALADGCSHVAFLDSDDWWANSHLFESIEHLNTSDVVFSNPTCFADTGEQLWPTIFIPEGFSGFHLNQGNFIWISSVVANINCFIDKKFVTEFNGVEDWDMWLQLYYAGSQFTKNLNNTSFYLVRPQSERTRGHTIVPKIHEKYKHLFKNETQ